LQDAAGFRGPDVTEFGVPMEPEVDAGETGGPGSYPSRVRIQHQYLTAQDSPQEYELAVLVESIGRHPASRSGHDVMFRGGKTKTVVGNGVLPRLRPRVIACCADLSPPFDEAGRLELLPSRHREPTRANLGGAWS
jgi:hypothetical protein